MPPVSPKAVAAFLTPVVAAVLLYLLTGDEKWLIGVLAGFASGGGAAFAPPAPGVKQRQVADLIPPRRRK
jgi:hypothetical protein